MKQKSPELLRPKYLQEKYYPVFDSILEEIGSKYKDNLSAYVAAMARYRTIAEEIYVKLSGDLESGNDEDISRFKRSQKLYDSLANLVGSEKLGQKIAKL